MEQNEPTTGEIVQEARRVMLDAWGCAGCDLRTVLRQAVDRLESQERELLKKTQELESAKIRHAQKDEEAAELFAKAIARAESAEAERDAAIKDIRKQCETCFHHSKDDIPHCTIGANGKCYFGGYDYWQWRGLQPKDGGEK